MVLGLIFYYFIKDSPDLSLIDIFWGLYYFSLFCIFFVFIKYDIKNFFISLPILIVVIYISLISLLGYDWWLPEFEVTYLILMLLPLFILLAYTFKEKNIRKIFISLATIIITVFISFYGFLDYEWWWDELLIIHLSLGFVSALAIFFYTFKDKYLWWLIFSPVVPMLIMYILEEFYPCLKPVGLGAA